MQLSALHCIRFCLSFDTLHCSYEELSNINDIHVLEDKKHARISFDMYSTKFDLEPRT